MTTRVFLPITEPESSTIVPHEEYNLVYHDLHAKVVIDNWQYCTQFNVPINHDKLNQIGVQNEKRSHLFEGNALIEHNNHDVGEINLHYRRLISDLLESGCIDKRDALLIGERQCAGLYVTCLLNTSLNLKRFASLYPYVRRITNDAVSLEVSHLVDKEVLQDGMSMFKFSAQEYQKLCETEEKHRKYNGLIEPSIRNNEDANDMTSVSRAKVYISSSGRIVMTGTLNRRATINAAYNVLQAVACCV